MQPQKAKKIEGLTLLQRLRNKYQVELGMEMQGRWQLFLLEGTKNKKILISTNEGEFIAEAKTIKEAKKQVALYENVDPSFYDNKEIITTYVAEEEVVETKMYEELMPSKLTSKNGIKMYDKKFYIVKKKPNGKSSGKAYCLYNFDTRNLLWAHWDRDILIGWLATQYKKIEHKDV